MDFTVYEQKIEDLVSFGDKACSLLSKKAEQSLSLQQVLSDKKADIVRTVEDEINKLTEVYLSSIRTDDDTDNDTEE